MYSDIAQILNNHDIKGFTKYTDHLCSSKWQKEFGKKIQSKRFIHNC